MWEGIRVLAPIGSHTFWAASQIRVGRFLGWGPGLIASFFPLLALLVPRPLVFPWWVLVCLLCSGWPCRGPVISCGSSWFRPVKGPAEELWQAATGGPPVSEEPDQPRGSSPTTCKFVRVKLRAQLLAIGTRGHFSLAGND